jgi:hypothetical protein
MAYADAAGVDDEPSIHEAGEGHVGVSADNGMHGVRQLGEDLGPALQPGVNEDDFVVIAWCAWQDTAGPKPSTSRVTGCGRSASSATCSADNCCAAHRSIS